MAASMRLGPENESPSIWSSIRASDFWNLLWNLKEGPLETGILFLGPSLRLHVGFPECNGCRLVVVAVIMTLHH